MEKRLITPIFIFSLPRSGSTLLQRILGTHSEICTTSEPWLLLPFLYTNKEKGVFAEYGHRASVEAIQDFVNILPNGVHDYSAALREFVSNLYTKASQQKPGSRYYLDKTPRYHLIADQIIELFPDAKFIFLWRNPLAVAASVIDTFGSGKWQLYDFKIDLFDGLENLIETYLKYHKRAYALSFEDLILDTHQILKQIHAYLDLPHNTDKISEFTSVKLIGGMGDISGSKQYQELSGEPLKKWKQTLSNPLRKMWSVRYLRWIGSERLKLMGYDKQKLFSELSSIPPSLRNTPSDIVRIGFGLVNCALEVRIMRKKLKLLPSWYRIHGHT